MAETSGTRALRLGPEARVVIPADLRRALGVVPGDDLIAWPEGNRLN